MHRAANEELHRFLPGFHKSEAKGLEAFSYALIKRFLKIVRYHFEPQNILENRTVLRFGQAVVETIGETRIKSPLQPMEETSVESGEEG